MIIHCYFTNGLVDYACFFLETFKFYNGDNIMIVLTTRDLNKKQIKKLKRIYKNLDIINKSLDYQHICKVTDIDKEKIFECKHIVETLPFKRKRDLIKWKQYISIEDRYRNSILEVMNKYKHEDFLIHFDVDMYIRKSLDDLFNLVSKSDFTITFRLKEKKWRRVFGCLLGIKLNKKGFKFMRVWRRKIDEIPLIDKPFGYGQTSCYLAYEELKHDKSFIWGNIPEEYISRRQDQTAAIWSGNYTAFGKRKNKNIAERDFIKIRSGEIKLYNVYNIGES